MHPASEAKRKGKRQWKLTKDKKKRQGGGWLMDVGDMSSSLHRTKPREIDRWNYLCLRRAYKTEGYQSHQGSIMNINGNQ